MIIAATLGTTASVDAPFHNPADRDSIEIEVTDSRHPLFGRRFPLVSVSAPPLRPGGLVFVAYRDQIVLKLPVVATSLAPQALEEARSKLTPEALQELFTLAEECGVAPCRSDPNASGGACPTSSAPRSPQTSPRSSRR